MWLSRRTGKGYRLPSESEREHAARAGTTTPFWFGSSISTSQANYDACFWPSWRPLRDRVKAVIGNHDDRNRSVFFTNWPGAGGAR